MIRVRALTAGAGYRQYDCCALVGRTEYQAGIVIANAVFRVPNRTNYRIVPRFTFTDPELAHIGMTEAQARECGIEPDVPRFPFRDVDRAITEGECAGLVKLVAYRDRLLGASVLGPRGGELLHELALAMTTGARLGTISVTIHAYPTLAQVHRRAVNTWLGRRLFSRGTRRLVRTIHHLLP